MEIVKKTENYIILKKKSGRFGIRTHARTWIRGEEKIKILVEEGLIEETVSKKQSEPEAEVKALAEEEAPAPNAE